MRRRTVLAGLAAAVLGATAAAHDSVPSGDAAPALGSEVVFELVAPDGKMVRSADLRGRWLLVFFGYTSCPDLCPTALNEIAGTLAQLGSLAARIQPIFISIDPERDTPETLREYASAFDRRILPLSGNAGQLAATAKAFGVVFYKVPGAAPSEYTFAHNAITTLIGPEGGLVARFSTDATAEWLAVLLRKLIDSNSS